MFENHALIIFIRYVFILVICYFFYINIPTPLLISDLSNQAIKQIELLSVLIFSALFWGGHLLFLQRNHREAITTAALELSTCEALVRNAGHIIFHLNEKEEITFLSPICKSILGYDEIELISHPFSSLFLNRSDFEMPSPPLKSGEAKNYSLQSRLVCKDGTFIWAEIRMVFHFNDQGWQILGCIGDITQCREHSEYLQVRERILNTLIEELPYLIYIHNQKNELLLVNQFFCDFVDRKKEQLVIDHLPPFFYDQTETILDTFFTCIDHDKNEGIKELANHAGDKFQFHFSQTKIINQDAEDFILNIGKPLDENIRHTEVIEHFLQYDQLTGLLNRNVFINRLENCLNNVKNTVPMAICVVDLYDFKRINDTLGHETGDQVLKYTAQKIGMLGEQVQLLSRYNGDEFAFVLTDVHSIDSLHQVIDELRLFFEAPLRLAGTELKITLNIGIVLTPDDGLTADVLLKKLDIALHVAKSTSSAQTQIYAGELEESLQKKMRIEKYLANALSNSELSLVFQPFVSGRNESLVGAEVLLRWHNDELGQVGPDQFIPVAEHTGEIIKIGSWVIEQACLQLKKWQGNFSDDFYLAVNVSPRQFLYGDLVNVVKKAIKNADIIPHSLEIEITEGLLLGDQTMALATMRELVELGVRLSLDDFGTGYSSLSYLKKFPFDCLKIDRAFISDLNNNNKDNALVTAITEMAHALELSVVAEGVEDREQLYQLQLLDVDIIQGYYFSKPLPAKQFENWNTQNREFILDNLEVDLGA